VVEKSYGKIKQSEIGQFWKDTLKTMPHTNDTKSDIDRFVNDCIHRWEVSISDSLNFVVDDNIWFENVQHGFS